MLYSITTAEVYRFQYLVPARSPEEAISKVSRADGVQYVQTGHEGGPAEISILHIEERKEIARALE